MADEGKEQSADVPETKQRGGVNDADFSMLMVHFRSAKLSSPPVFVKSGEKSDLPCSQHQTEEEDIVTPLQNFHLRPPAHSSCRRRKKRRSSNELNLSVAAGSIHRRPMVWPARLKATEAISQSLLHPARLSAMATLTKSSDDRVASISANKALNKKVVETLQKNTSLDLKSFSSSGPASSSSASSLSARLFGDGQSASSQSEKTMSFHKLKSSTPKTSCTSKQNVISLPQQSCHSSSRLFENFPLSSSEAMNNSYRNTQLPSVASLPDDPPLVRSCSSEMRLVEETNVNELASYLDDLLYIPRNMSTMAEMMYA